MKILINHFFLQNNHLEIAAVTITTTNSTTTSGSSNSSSSDSVIIAAIVIPLAAFFVVLSIGVLCLCRRHRNVIFIQLYLTIFFKVNHLKILFAFI